MSTYYKWTAEHLTGVDGAKSDMFSITIDLRGMRWQRAPEQLKKNVTDGTFTLRKKQKYRIVSGNNLFWFKDINTLLIRSVYWRDAIFDECGRRGALMEAVI